MLHDGNKNKDKKGCTTEKVCTKVYDLTFTSPSKVAIVEDQADVESVQTYQGKVAW